MSYIAWCSDKNLTFMLGAMKHYEPLLIMINHYSPVLTSIKQNIFPFPAMISRLTIQLCDDSHQISSYFMLESPFLMLRSFW